MDSDLTGEFLAIAWQLKLTGAVRRACAPSRVCWCASSNLALQDPESLKSRRLTASSLNLLLSPCFCHPASVNLLPSPCLSLLLLPPPLLSSLLFMLPISLLACASTCLVAHLCCAVPIERDPNEESPPVQDFLHQGHGRALLGRWRSACRQRGPDDSLR